MFEPDYEWLDDTPVLAETIAGLLCIEFFRSIDGGFLVGNYVKVVGGSGPVLVQIPMRSFGIPADEVSARTLGMAMESILEFDQSHVGVTVSRVSKRAWKQVSMRVTGKPESQWKRCCVTFNPHSGWTARSDVVSLRWSGDVDSRLNDVGTVVCPCGAGVGELGGMVLESYARVDAWCARNGRNPYTGMPCPLREDLGGDGVLVLTPPAYFQEDYAPGPGVVRGYYHHVDAMALPQEPGSRWYGDWVRGLDAWLCWRVVPAGGVDGLLGAWQAAHGRVVEVSSVGCEGEPGAGCFSSRGVVSNRSWASYWFRRELASGSVLELVLDVKQPGRRKRLAGKAVKAWERCARHTQLLPPDDAAGTQA